MPDEGKLNLRSPLIQACIFDLDGVIVDTAKYHYLAWSKLAKELGISFNEQDNERLKGVSRMASLDILLSLGNRHPSQAEKEDMAARKNGWFVEYINHIDRSEMFPGVERLLSELRNLGMKLGLASSSKNAPQVVKSLGISDAFDTIVDGSMVTRAKPDPEIFLLAAQRLNVRPLACLVFEDAAAGVEAAHAAAMKCVGIGTIDQLGKADIVIGQTGTFDTHDLLKL